MKLLVLFSIMYVTFATSAKAVESAKVIMIRGKVTKLSPGQMAATQVKRGQQLIEDTSVVTGNKSVVRLRFADKSSLTLGPNSMVIVEKMPKKEATMVNLLNGMMKAQVNKHAKKNTKTKMLVKTRSAVMGVRGTKFQAMYNPQIKSTSLITVEGKVAMVKTAPKPAAEVAKKVTSHEVQNIDKIFETKEVVEVPAGKFSGVVESVEAPTAPVKIAPKQYDAIAKTMGSKKRAKDVMKVKAGDIEADKIANAGKVVPKAGGMVDFSTGLYVPPAADAALDKVTGTFELTKKMGKINTKTGDYIAPKGIKLDAKKGFIIDNKVKAMVASTAKNEELQKTLQSIKSEVKENKMWVKTKKKPTKPWYDVGRDHILSFTLKPYSGKQTVKNKNSGSEAEFYTKSAKFSYFTWEARWSEKWSSRLSVGGHDYEIDDSDVNIQNNNYYNEDDDRRGGNYFSMGTLYQYSKDTNLSLDLVERSDLYVVPDIGGFVYEQMYDSKAIYLGYHRALKPWRDIQTYFHGTIHLYGDEEAPGFSNDNTADKFGFELAIQTKYQWTKKLAVDTSLFWILESTENDDLEYTNNAFGLGFKFIWDI